MHPVFRFRLDGSRAPKLNFTETLNKDEVKYLVDLHYYCKKALGCGVAFWYSEKYLYVELTLDEEELKGSPARILCLTLYIDLCILRYRPKILVSYILRMMVQRVYGIETFSELKPALVKLILKPTVPDLRKKEFDFSKLKKHTYRDLR